MKKFTFFIVMIMAISSMYAQSRSAFKLNFGYCIPIMKSRVGDNYYSGYTSYSTGTYATFGKGTKVEAGYEYALLRSLSLQLEVAYFNGRDITTDGFLGIYSNTENSLAARFFFVTPSLKFNTYLNSAKIYCSLGPSIGFGKMKGKTFAHNPWSNVGTEIAQEYVYKGSMAIGIKTSLGVEKNFGPVALFFETSILGMTYAPSEGEVTKYSVDGQDKLYSLSPGQKKFTFVETLDSNSQGQVLKQYYPLNNLSLTVGVLYRLGSAGAKAQIKS